MTGFTFGTALKNLGCVLTVPVRQGYPQGRRLRDRVTENICDGVENCCEISILSNENKNSQVLLVQIVNSFFLEG